MKIIYHEALGECLMHAQYIKDGKSLMLVSEILRGKRLKSIDGTSLHHRWGVKPYISSKRKYSTVYWIIWGNIEDVMERHGITPLIHPTGRPVIENTATKRFLEMIEELPHINFSKK
jgi:hypothetical protein